MRPKDKYTKRLTHQMKETSIKRQREQKKKRPKHKEAKRQRDQKTKRPKD